MGKLYDVGIIGSGPAGLTAAIYTSRAFLKTLVLSGDTPGGQLTTTTEVDNFPGFPNGITGPKLMEELEKQAKRFTVIFEAGNVKKITPEKNIFTIETSNESHQATSVIIATGATPKKLGLPSEERFRGKGISYCATCDGFFFRNKEVIVVGGGDTAMEEATFLTTFASHVTIIHRRDEFRASPIMLEKAKRNSKISFLTNKIIEEFIGDTMLQGVELKDAVTGKTSSLGASGVFIAIGHKPTTDFLHGFLKRNDKGYISVSPPTHALDYHTATSVPGVFAAGDCVDERYRQAVVAAGMGCMAALDVQRWLTEEM